MVKIRNIFLVCTIIVCIGLPGVAQIHHSYFSNYTIRNGLADNIIHYIYQDSKGWVWLGTTYGAVRFDGYSFMKFSDIGR